MVTPEPIPKSKKIMINEVIIYFFIRLTGQMGDSIAKNTNRGPGIIVDIFVQFPSASFIKLYPGQ